MAEKRKEKWQARPREKNNPTINLNINGKNEKI